MAYKVSFTIDGDPQHGIKALQGVGKALDALASGAKSSAAQMDAAFDRVRGKIGDLGNVIRTVRSDLQNLATSKSLKDLEASFNLARASAVTAAASVRNMANALGRISTSSLRGVGAAARTAATAAQSAAAAMTRTAVSAQGAATRMTNVAAAAQRVGQHTATAQRAAHGWAGALGAVESAVTRIGRRMGGIAVGVARGVGGFGQQFGRIGAQGAGSVQSLGIGLRMSGIAFGQQASQLGTQGLGGLVKMVPGILSVIAEAGARSISALAGLGVRWAGSIASGLLAGLSKAVPAVLTSVFGGLGSFLGKITGPVLAGVGAIVGGVTNLAGEVVTQLGNVFTGLVEAARGAFQGVLNVAGELLGRLVEIVGDIAGRVGGILGTIGKTILGTGAVIGGFAFRDVVSTDSGIAKVNVLLETKVTPAQRASLQEWTKNLQREIGGASPKVALDTLERAVSTGFQGDLEGGKKLATQALKLAKVGGEIEVAPTAARVMAKTFSLFKDEFKSADPFAEIADGIQALVNYGDLKLPEIVNRLGEILASGKAVGASFADVMVVLAQMSQSLGVEQTFTDVRHLFTDPLKFSKDAKSLLESRGIKLNEPSEAEAAKIASLQARLADAEARAGGKGILRDAKTGVASSAEKVRVRKDEITQEIANLEYQKKGLGKNKEAKAAIDAKIKALADEGRALSANNNLLKVGTAAYAEGIRDAADEAAKLRKELADAERAVQETRNPLSLFADIMKAGFSPGEASTLFPNKRALVGYLVQAFQSPDLAKAIEQGVRNSAGAVDSGMAIMEDTIGSRFEKVWAGIKAPFVSTFDAMTPTLNRFLDTAISGLQTFGDWWSKVIADPGAAAFFDRIASGLGRLVSIDFGGMLSFTQDSGSVAGFWTAMNTGLDTMVTFGERAVTTISTLWNWVSKLVGPDVIDGIGRVAASAASWTGSTIGQLSEGKTDNLDAIVASIRGAWRDGIDYVSSAWSTLVSTGKDLWNEGGRIFDNVLTTMGDVFEKLRTLALVVFAGSAAGALVRGGVGGGGGAGGLPVGVAAGPVGSLARGVSRGANAFLAYQAADMLGLLQGPVSRGAAAGGAIGHTVAGPVGAGIGAAGGAIIGFFKDGIDSIFEGQRRAAERDARLSSYARPQIDTSPEANRAALDALTDDERQQLTAAGIIVPPRRGDPLGVDITQPVGSPLVPRRGEPLRGPIIPDILNPKAPGPILPLRDIPAERKAKAAAAAKVFEGVARSLEKMPTLAEGPADGGVIAKSLTMMPGKSSSGVMSLSEALQPRQYDGYTYDKSLGVYRSGMKDVGPGAFGNGLTATGGFIPSSLAKKLRRAEADPMFEGGRWEKYTSRGKAAAEAQQQTAGSNETKAKITEGADKLSAIDVSRLDDIEKRVGEILGKSGDLLPKIIDSQDTHSKELVDLVSNGFKKIDGTTRSHTDRIKTLEDVIDALQSPEAAAGNLGVPGSP